MSRYADTHVDPQGPGDARPTALQVVQDEGLLGDKLAGKIVLVTGANSGIGVETSRAIHATGATLFVTARDAAKAQLAVDSIKNGPGPKSGAPIHAIELRLDSLASVRAAAKDFLAKSGGKLNILILNAGVMATPEGKTEDGFETQFGTNHLGHFLLFQLLKPALLAASTPEFQSRVVSVSSMAHRFGNVRLDDFNFEKDPYDPWAAYGQSKTANILFANEVERRYGSKGVHALSLHPGIIQTNLSQYLPPDRIEEIAKDEALKKNMKSVPQGAATTVYAALSKEWEGRPGRYLSDLVEQGPADMASQKEAGHAPWVYDEAAAKELWEKSNKLVGFVEE
ncbi:short-chain dehydrogenase [Colletotrichum higginsianum]|uniref:Short-chain dehydrogenase n=2 Tax=Colletotrichum higginsianum TaxID=80884 RepID=H1V370_COLHI|nr:Short-chain dehydrogenase [Colletotrichum higginsianum IMI 349063]OBR10571.1 Short-chain dehydrogenase [Colletotrichum higginsianum IMI 349063]TIC91010.1 Short-chain dehydrogenase TIC 32, chloroplastic [Colletotrichum higginsianum]GJD04851.1 short-chain dehydrogenase [Colletotrichum higginsianum]CCF34672.1 short-chain dehydrogenase [Colletotrichum higginsianum]